MPYKLTITEIEYDHSCYCQEALAVYRVDSEHGEFPHQSHFCLSCAKKELAREIEILGLSTPEAAQKLALLAGT